MLRRYHRVAANRARKREQEQTDEFDLDLEELAPGKLSLVEAWRRLARANASPVTSPGRLTLAGGQTEQIRARSRRRGQQRHWALAQAQHERGEPLPAAMRKSLEAALGIDLSAVRVHRGPNAATASRMLDAAAFAAGRDIFFGAGNYAPETPRGRWLLAHEVAHTAQAPAPKNVDLAHLPVSSPGDVHERQADAFATAFSAGGATAQVGVAPASLSRFAGDVPAAAGASTETAGTETTEPDHDAALAELGIDEANSPRLHKHIKDALTAGDGDIQRAVDAGDPGAVIAAGRKHWRTHIGDNFVYLCQLAEELGDAQGGHRIKMVFGDLEFADDATATKVKADYFRHVADLVERGRGATPPPSALDGADSSPLVAVLTAHPELLRQGRTLEWQNGNPLLHRYSRLEEHFAYHTKRESFMEWTHQAYSLVSDDARDEIDHYSPLEEFETLIHEYYAYEVSRDPAARSALPRQLTRDDRLTHMMAYEVLFARPLEPPNREWPGVLTVAASEHGVPDTGLVHLWLDPKKVSANLAQGNAAPRKPTTLDIFHGHLPALAANRWLVPDPDRIEALAHGQFVKEGAAGFQVTPVPNLAALHENIAAFMAQFGNADGKAKFSADNAPVAVKVDVGRVTDLWLPPGSRDHVSMSEPGITHPGARIKQIDLRLKDGASDDDKLVRSGTAHMDIDAGGAFSRRNAQVELKPPPKAGEGAADAEPHQDGGPQVKNLQSPLSRLLGRVDLDASLIDNGIEVSAKVKPGRSGIPGLEVDQADFQATYSDAAVGVSATLGLHDHKRRLQANAELGWDGTDFTVHGDAELEIDGFPTIAATVTHEAGETAIQITNEPTFHEELSAVTLDGKARGLAYETGRRGGLSGEVEVHADLGILGEADTAATLEDSEISHLAFDLQSRQLSFQVGGTPIVTGEASGQIAINDNRPSGRVAGKAKLHIPHLDEIPDLDIDLRVDREGQFHGGIRARNIDLGGLLHLSHVDIEFGDGKPSGRAKVAVTGIPFLDKCELDWTVNERGVSLDGAKVELSGLLDEVTRDRLSADLGLDGGNLHGNLTVKAGPSGIPGFDLGDTAIEFATQGGKLTSAAAQFSLGYNRGGGEGGGGPSIGGSGSMTWNGSDWDLSGTVSVANLTEGLSPFAVTVTKSGKDIQVTTDEQVTYHRDFGGVAFDGQASNITYDVRKRSFSGEAAISADFGMFGKTEASATIADNALEEADLAYENPELRYPAGADKPLLSGTARGNIHYRHGKFSGALTSRANLELPDIIPIGNKDGEDVGAEVHVSVHPDGKYSGSIQSLRPIEVGKYFRVPRFSGEIDEEGNINSEFAVALVNLKHVKNAELGFKIDKDGLGVTNANILVPFGEPNGSRAWGNFGAFYTGATGLELFSDAHVKIRDDLVGDGLFRYSFDDNTISGRLGIDKLQILTFHKSKELFNLSKKIPVFSVGIAGVAIDIGLSMSMDFLGDLWLSPSLELNNLDFDDFSYDSAVGRLGMGGELSASLTADPHIGVGAFVIAPALLYGGGGLKFELAAKTSIIPSGEMAVAFDRDGNLQTGAKLILPLTFGVTGALSAEALFKILDGHLGEMKWEETLAEFELLPPTEIFRYEIDLGESITETTDPAFPDKPAPAGETSGGGTTMEQTEEPKTVDAPAIASPPKEAPADSADNDSGFDIGKLLQSITHAPGIQPIWSVIETAAEIWEKIKDVLGTIGRFFSSIVEVFGEAIEDVLHGIGEHGLFGYIKILLKGILGETAFYVLEPLLDALCESEEQIVDIITSLEPPSSPSDFLDWTMNFLGDFLGFAFDSIGNLIHAIGEMKDRLGHVIGKFLNQMVQEGRIGVNQYPYYFLWDDFLAPTEYKIKVGGVDIYNIDRGNITDPEDLVAFGLWEALEHFDDVIPTNTAVDEDSGDHFNDYWVGSPRKWQNM